MSGKITVMMISWLFIVNRIVDDCDWYVGLKMHLLVPFLSRFLAVFKWSGNNYQNGDFLSCCDLNIGVLFFFFSHETVNQFFQVPRLDEIILHIWLQVVLLAKKREQENLSIFSLWKRDFAVALTYLCLVHQVCLHLFVVWLYCFVLQIVSI